ncbi:hypothetical protein B0H13DRAFT_2365566 [Mycena leptocephala]|nr:hypothetical protein B0H13DRAFT_2365566 [Mycena leptocephala]
MTITYQLREPERNLRDPRCPVFALIIGIDEYQSNAIPDLRGCVNDAQTIKTYLTNRFHIPETQIAFLANQDATRGCILTKFQTHLISNAFIEKDDAIIIYYAGHGSRATAPDSWPSTDGKIETLVRTTSGEIRNNITVILDCCHSASGTRGSGPGILPTPRFVETLLPIPENLDQDLFGGRSGEISLPPGASYKFMHSHVLLAACRQQQRARECLSATGEPCGFFTNSLISQLRRIGPNRITYADLLDLLPTLPDQNPQCEGENKDRYLFEVQGPAHEPTTYALVVKEDGLFEVEIGSLHGVVAGTQFVLKADTSSGQELDRILVAASVNLDSSILIPITPKKDLNFPDGARLIVSDWKNDAAMMKVYVHASESPQLAISDVVSVQRTRTNFLVVDSLDTADLAVRRASDNEFTLSRLDAKISRYAMPDVHLSVPSTNFPFVLDAISHFNYFLGKHNGRDDPFAGEVALEMYNLRGEFGSRVPNRLLGNLVIDGEVRFRLDPQEKYGFAICNYSQYDLFPYLFYFDPASYSIDAWYLPSSPTMAPPLPAKSDSSTEPTRITVGYGAAGGYAFQFVIPEGMTSDTGFLKLFVSTKYLDLKRIEQPAAVDVIYGGERDADTHRPEVEKGEMWDAVDVAVTMYIEEPEQ